MDSPESPPPSDPDTQGLAPVLSGKALKSDITRKIR